ncbi:xylulokinase [Varibaculum prostatecancerukia]|uniref:xylulokinase n=1 Tax=Varibaculum prostatecancerukia TaxID=2811781 RepID=UPI001C00186C|nr:FGGY-family carbohydrate kinase [Varibaculum prostatecancerukia]
MYCLTYDVGTTGVKTCLFEVSDQIRPLASASEGYGLQVVAGGGIEQNPDDWWQAMASATAQIKAQAEAELAQIKGISFCSQMQSLVLLDKNARPVHPSMSYMDQRGGVQLRKIAGQAPRIAGINLVKLLRSLYHTGAVSASVKDPVWKYHWMKENRPEELSKAHKWLDVKDAIIARMTGEFNMSEDSAFSTLLYDIRSKEKRFSPAMLKMMQVDPALMPPIVASTDIVGSLRPQQARELGLKAGIPVFSGGGDASLIPVGAGAAGKGDTHVYMGTSGWVETVTDKITIDTSAMIATVVGAISGNYNYFAEMETAGKCLEWVRDHLAKDEIHIYLDQKDVAEDPESEFHSLYEYMSKVIDSAPAGAGGVLFAPWLHGNRCPFEDPNARGAFIGIGLETGKTELLRAVVEGVCYHVRWFLETQEKKVETAPRLRFVGGGALSPVTCQILADITGKPVDTVANPQDVGAVGAALVIAAGLGEIPSLAKASSLVPVTASYEPNPEHKDRYDQMFAAFKDIYPANKKIFAQLEAIR